MDTELSHYFRDGSPFLPDVELEILNPIIRDLALEQGYFMGEAIAKGLGIIGSTNAVWALSRKSSKRSAKPEDLAEYFRGFHRPLSLLMIAYAGLVEENGLEAAQKILSHSYKDDVTELNFLLDNLSFAVDQLYIDQSGIELINQIGQRESSRVVNLYYKIGLEAARRTFTAYSKILDTLVPRNADEEDIPSSLFFRLIEYEKDAPTSPKELPKKARELEKALAKLIEDPSCSTSLFVFLRHPRLIPKLISMFTRFIYSAFKNPAATEREMSRIAGALPKAQKEIREGWESGQLISGAAQEFTTLGESLSQVMPPYPYSNERFVEKIQLIRDLNQRASNDSAAGRLLEEWERLGEQLGLEEYSALWTATHIALGDFAKQQFILTGEKERRFIRIAKRAYSTPLKQSALVKADLGTRRICAVKLGELYCKYGSHLEMLVIELARAIYNTYSDVLKSNERLYQRSPYRESREKLQDRAALAVARTIESCVYLGGSDKIKEVNWLREAVIIAENGKSRMLRGEMALAKRLPPLEIPSTYGDDEEKCLDLLRKIYAADLARRKYDFLNEPSSSGEISEADKLRLELETIWTQMENHGDTARSYIAVRRDEGIQWEDLQGLAERLGRRFAIVSMYRLPDSVFLSVLRAGWEAPKAYIVPLSRESMQQALYACHMHTTNEWQTLGDLLFSPLQSLLSDVEYVYFFPHGPFNLLPLHALTVDGKPIIERWAVVYAPSASVLDSALARPKSKGDALIMGYASFSDPLKRQPDAMILQEADELATHFQTPPMSPEMCDAKTLRERSLSARLIHLSCHGEFIEGDPLASYVHLADGPFTARNWLELRLQADLVTLSACESGVSQIHVGGDPVGLMRAILFAGASSLLTTLWSVNSLSTLKWMLKFYDAWNKDGLQTVDKATAFREATLELMKDKAFRDPYYWAPFVLVGNYA